MSIITLDFETYFSDTYSLRKLTVEEYVRGSEFEALCVGLKKDKEGAECFPAKFLFGHPRAAELNKQAIVCHHAHFDGFILNHHYRIKPVFWFDALSMARLVFPHDKSHSLESLANKFNLGHKTVPYEEFKGKHWNELAIGAQSNLSHGCNQDVELTYKIFKKLLPFVPPEELKIIDLNIRLFTEPVLQLDVDRASRYLKQLQQDQTKLLLSLGLTKKDLGSSEKFAEILRGYGIEPPTKVSPRTGKQAYAFAKTDPGMVELLENEDGEIGLLAQARLSTKSTIGETRAGRLISTATRGGLPVYLKYYGAHTGRFSGGDKVNYQNFQRGGELRKSLLAPGGYVLCVVDLSQIEVRVLAYIAQEDWVLKAFKEGRDLYCEMATDVSGRNITKDNKAERFVGKTLVLGAGYGVGWEKLQATLKLAKIYFTEGECRAAIDAYRSKNPNIVGLWACCDNLLRKMYEQENYKSENFCGCMSVANKLISLPNGAYLDYTHLEINKENSNRFVLNTPRGFKNLWGGVVTENVTQALARIVMTQAMLKIAKLYKIVLHTHDELVYLVPEDEAEMGLEIGINLMTASPAWASGIPLAAEGGYAREYSK